MCFLSQLISAIAGLGALCDVSCSSIGLVILALKVLFSGTLRHVHTKDVLMIALTFQSDLFIIISILKSLS